MSLGPQLLKGHKAGNKLWKDWKDIFKDYFFKGKVIHTNSSKIWVNSFICSDNPANSRDKVTRLKSDRNLYGTSRIALYTCFQNSLLKIHFCSCSGFPMPGNSYLQAQPHWNLYSEIRKINSGLQNRYVTLKGCFSKEQSFVHYVVLKLGLAVLFTCLPSLFTSCSILILEV